MTSNRFFQRRLGGFFALGVLLCLFGLFAPGEAVAQTPSADASANVASMTDAAGSEGGIIRFVYTAPAVSADASLNARFGVYEISGLADARATISTVTGLSVAPSANSDLFPLSGMFVMSPGQRDYYFYVRVNTDDDTDDEAFTFAVTSLISYPPNGSGSYDFTMGVEIPTAPADASGNIIDREPLAAAEINDINQKIHRTAAAQATNAINEAASSAIEKQVHSAFDGDRSASIEVQGGGLAQYLKTVGGNGDGRALRPQSVAVVLAADGESGIGNLGAPAVWANNYHRRLDFGTDGAKFDGVLRGTMLGADIFINKQLLFGLSVIESHTALDFTYDRVSGDHTSHLSGDHNTHLRGMRPYFGWQSQGGVRLWGSAGVENGTVEVRQSGYAGADTGPVDVRVRSFVGGVYNPLYTLGDIDRVSGMTRVGFSGDIIHARLRDTETESFAAESGRARMRMQYEHNRRMENNGYRGGSMAMAFRYDRASDGPSGSGMEASGGLDWRFPQKGIRLHVDARTLLTHDDDIGEWGFSGTASWEATNNGRGLSLSFKPQWGDMASDGQALWEQGVAATRNHVARHAARHDWEAKYGIALPRENQSLTLFLRDRSDATGWGADYKMGAALTAGYEAVVLPDNGSAADTDHRGYIRYRQRF